MSDDARVETTSESEVMVDNFGGVKPLPDFTEDVPKIVEAVGKALPYAAVAAAGYLVIRQIMS